MPRAGTGAFDIFCPRRNHDKHIQPIGSPRIVRLDRGELPLSRQGREGPLIGPLDINSQETGDGAGCFFAIAEDALDSYVFVDRDGYGWMRIGGEIQKFEPEDELIMWPSRQGDTLNLVHTSDESQVELSIAVSTGCGEREDNCAVEYGGTLTLSVKGVESTTKVKGHCAC